jgi:hypothetical protein
MGSKGIKNTSKYIGQKTNVKFLLLYLLQQTDIAHISNEKKLYLNLKGIEMSVNCLDGIFFTITIIGLH